MSNVTLVGPDQKTPLGASSDSPLFTTGGTGGGTTGSVTAPGTSGTQAQAVQGITGGVPLPVTWSSQSIAATQSGSWSVTINGTAAVADQTLANVIGTAADPVVASGNGTVVSQLKGILARLTSGIGVTDTATETGLGTPSDTAATSGGNGGVIAQLKGIFAKLSGSIAVTGTFYQATQPVSIAGGQDVSTGAQADAAASGTSITTGSFSVIALLKGIYNACMASIPAGSNIIGKVGIDQTTPGTTNGVVVNSSALPTGAATAVNQVLPFGSVAAGTAASYSVLGGGVYNSAAPTLTNGQQVAAQYDVNGNQKVNVTSGTVTANQGGAPWSFNVTQQAGTTLGAPTAYGTPPSGNVPGVNANVTTSALPAGAATSANQIRVVTYPEYDLASLAASATTAKNSRPTPSPAIYSKFNAFFRSDQAGTYTVEGSTDGFATKTVVVTTGALTANTPVQYSTPIMYPYYRAYITNGTTAATAVSQITSYTAN